MDNEDDSSLSPTPNVFILSTYNENPLVTMSQAERSEKLKILRSKRREEVLSLLDKDDHDEFQQYVAERPMHAPFSDRMFVLKKLNAQKKLSQSAFQSKLISSIETRQMREDIQLRKIRHKLAQHSLQKLREENQQKKQQNMQTQKNIDEINLQIRNTKENITKAKKYIRSSRAITEKKKTEVLSQDERHLQRIRREHLNELRKYVLPIGRVKATNDVLTTIMKDLRNALKTFKDGSESKQGEDDEPVIPQERYQIVDSFLPIKGNYQIESLVAVYNDAKFRQNANSATGDLDSFQLSSSSDAYDTLSALSHACQLINAVAFFLDIKLPFHLHQCEFTKDCFTVDDLRADIAKLNVNITSSCLSQGIHVELNEVWYTFENLWKLFTVKHYPTRPREITYPDDFIALLKKEVIDVSRALSTSYWFDDDDDKNDRVDVTDTWDEDEYELVPQNEYIPDDLVISNQHSDSSPSTSGQQQSTLMSSSLEFIRNQSSNILGSIFRSSRS